MFLQRPNEDMLGSTQYRKNYVLHELSSDVILALFGVWGFFSIWKKKKKKKASRHPQFK